MTTATSMLAHEQTPTYFKVMPSEYNDIYYTDIKVFNRRNDVKFYAIEVYDEEWNPVAYGASNRVFRLEYLKRKQMRVYFREVDKDKVVYVCTKSKIAKKSSSRTAVSSRICSKVER